MPQQSPTVSKSQLDVYENNFHSSFVTLSRKITHIYRTRQRGANPRVKAELERKLNAIIQTLAGRYQLVRVVRQLKAQGIALDETKIFVS